MSNVRHMRTSARFLRASVVAPLPVLLLLAGISHALGFIPVEGLRVSATATVFFWAVLLLVPAYLALILIIYASARLLERLGMLSRSTLVYACIVVALALGALVTYSPAVPVMSLLWVVAIAVVALPFLVASALLWWRVARVGQ